MSELAREPAPAEPDRDPTLRHFLSYCVPVRFVQGRRSLLVAPTWHLSSGVQLLRKCFSDKNKGVARVGHPGVCFFNLGASHPFRKKREKDGARKGARDSIAAAAAIAVERAQRVAFELPEAFEARIAPGQPEAWSFGAPPGRP